MTTTELMEITDRIMALPPAERAAIAQTVWQSIEEDEALIPPQSDAEAIATARQRDAEMSEGGVSQRSHQEVMQDARRAIQCK
ncbi:MAG: addiction module protein [Patescibacteria group bacterium]|nr:addiction module protein [Patescibacteria group bacterium]